MKITEKKVIEIFWQLERTAIKLYEKESYRKCLNVIECAAAWMYNFNVIYSSPSLEKIIHDIASKLLPKSTISNPDSNKVAFIDYFGYDNRGLTQQYLRGLIADNKKILYVLQNPNPIRKSEIIRELEEYDSSDILIIETKKNQIESAAIIARKIAEYSPASILLHIAPWDIVSLLAMTSIEGATKYNINLTDHAFWLGVSFVDYNIEFRGYGKMVSLQQRGFKDSQIIFLPYYPIISKYTEFQGFTDLPRNSTIIFCGGSEYKMLGKDGIFFTLMDEILSISVQAVIIVAGIEKDSRFSRHVEKMKNKERVYFIGNRRDINEVFAHSDIFLSSYPFIGGLMTQFAAMNSLPILAYAEPGEANLCEYLVNHFDNPVHSRFSMDDFLQYAEKLIINRQFREDEGKRNKSAMMNKGKFNAQLSYLLANHATTISLDSEQPDYKYMINFYLDLENQTHSAIYKLYCLMRFNTPLTSLPFLTTILPKIAKGLYTKVISITYKRLIS